MPRNTDLHAMSRQWEMLQLLPTKPPGMSSRELQNKLNTLGYTIVKRTVERDLQLLSEVFPILCNDKGKPYGWYWNPGVSANLPAITLAEALSLSVVEDLLKPLLPQAILSSLQAHFNQARVKLKTLQLDNPTARWQDKVRHVPPALPLLPPKLEPEVLDAVQQALLNDRQIEVLYEGAHKDKANSQTLHPLALVQRGPVTYLVATAFNYHVPRLYALHRIKAATISADILQRPADFNLDTYIASGALQFGTDSLHLKAKIHGDMVDYSQETRLAEDQQLEKTGEEWLLKATVADSWQLRWWILSLAEAIEVIEPPGLRAEISTRLCAGAAHYKPREAIT